MSAAPDFSRYADREKYASSIKAGYQAYFFDRAEDSCHYRDDNERAAWLYGFRRAREHIVGRDTAGGEW